MPLQPVEIKIEILRRGDTIAGLARSWGATPVVLSRVINRREPYLYLEVQEKLAEYMHVPVSDVGREPSPKRKLQRKSPPDHQDTIRTLFERVTKFKRPCS